MSKNKTALVKKKKIKVIIVWFLIQYLELLSPIFFSVDEAD